MSDRRPGPATGDLLDAPRRVRIPLRRLMAVVLVLGLALAAVRHAATRWTAAEVMTLALMLLPATSLVAALPGPRGKRFGIGFGIVGCVYLALCFASPLADHLPTAGFLDALHDRLNPSRPPSVDVDFGEALSAAHEHAEWFRRAGQSIISLVLGILGGILALIAFPSRAGTGETPLPAEGSLLGPDWRDVWGRSR